MVLVVIFSVQLNWLPAMGAGPGGSADWAWDWEHLQHLILPAVTLSVIPMGIVTRTVRGIVAEIMNQEFVTALRGKEACPYHYIAGSYPKANELARRYADDIEPDYDCARDVPTVDSKVGAEGIDFVSCAEAKAE